MQTGRVTIEKTAIILNGVLPWAQAGEKRSEKSLTETRAEAVGEIAGTSHRTASAHVQSTILHYVPYDGCIFG